jgi:hypothetical protein
LLLEVDDVAGEGDVVIGGEKRDQTDKNTGQSLKGALAIKPRESAAKRLRPKGIWRWNGQRLGIPTRN